MTSWARTVWGGMVANAGALDQRVQFQAQTETPDGMGGATQAWGAITPNADVWAKVRTKTPREGQSEEKIAASATVEFTIRNRSDITEKHAILWQGRLHNIRAIRDHGPRDLYLVIEAESGVSL